MPSYAAGGSGHDAASDQRSEDAHAAAGAAGAGGAHPNDAGGQGGALAEAGPDVSSSGAGGGGCDCSAGECGMYERCGALVDCGLCAGTSESCIKSSSPRFQNKVRTGIDQVKTDHPEYFDFTDPQGESVKIVDGPAYHDALVAAVSAQGLVCIVDPNFDHDIRVRHPSVQPDQAENYLIHTSWEYTAYKYTSTCAPAGF
ncbi:MAG: hypothetical protein HY898_14100 [Deltaproteobacteria bacterium]|nr:hypothetical protein [Deltaproteobacteria bacterium]